MKSKQMMYVGLLIVCVGVVVLFSAMDGAGNPVVAGVLLAGGAVWMMVCRPEGYGQAVCANCHYTGRAKKPLKGSVLIAVILWICFLVPGLIYSIWRRTGRVSTCPKCGAVNMVPLDTPRGRELVGG